MEAVHEVRPALIDHNDIVHTPQQTNPATPEGEHGWRVNLCLLLHFILECRYRLLLGGSPSCSTPERPLIALDVVLDWIFGFYMHCIARNYQCKSNWFAQRSDNCRHWAFNVVNRSRLTVWRGLDSVRKRIFKTEA